MTAYNQVAKKSNRKYSSLIDFEVLVIHCRKILRKIEEHMTALPSNAIEYADDRLAYPLYRSGRYNFGSKSVSLILHLLFTTFAMHKLVH